MAIEEEFPYPFVVRMSCALHDAFSYVRVSGFEEQNRSRTSTVAAAGHWTITNDASNWRLAAGAAIRLQLPGMR
jgi:hypothetical protein